MITSVTVSGFTFEDLLELNDSIPEQSESVWAINPEFHAHFQMVVKRIARKAKRKARMLSLNRRKKRGQK